MSFKITIYSREIEKNSNLLRFKYSHPLNISSIGQSALEFNWSFDQKLGRKERKHRTDLALFSTDLDPGEILRCADEVSDLSDNIWWGVIYKKIGNSDLDAFSVRGARYFTALNNQSLLNLVKRLNAEKISNASKYFHDDDL